VLTGEQKRKPQLSIGDKTFRAIMELTWNVLLIAVHEKYDTRQ
jgi:hypothetical protein